MLEGMRVITLNDTLQKILLRLIKIYPYLTSLEDERKTCGDFPPLFPNFL